MANIFNRSIATLLSLVMVASVFPLSVFATDDGVLASVENEMTATGENPVAKAFSEELSTQSNQEESPYWITDVDIIDNKIVVEYSNTGNCKLLVAAYTDDDNMQMLASEIVEVEANSETTSISLFFSLPKYYVIKAFLLASDNSALCESYTFTHKTKSFQDEFSKTVDDFDPERVINVDESKDENFFVLKEEDIIVQTTNAKNIYNESASNPSENKYVFNNCDNSLKSLQAGDIFYLKNGDDENLIVIKVKSINTNGNTVTITADDMDLEEAFEHIDLNIDVGLQDSVIEDGEMEDGVTYEGRDEDNSGLGTQGVEYGDKFGWKDKFSVQKEFEDDGGNDSASIKFSASLELGLEGQFKAYVSLGYKEVSFKMSAKASVTLSISGKADAYIPLCPGIDFSPVPGLFIGLKPALKIELSAEISVSGTLTFTLGVGWDTNNGFKNKSKGPEFKPEVKVEGKFFIGLDLRPRVYVVAESVAKAELSGTVGLEIKATMSTESIGSGDSRRHDCCLGGFACIDGDISVRLKIGAGISFGEGTLFEIKKETTIWNKNLHFADFYYSLKYNEFGWGSCPHLEYKLTITVKDSSGNPISGAKVLDLTTDSKGQVSNYYPSNTTVKYVVIANGYSNARGSLYVKDESVTKTITMQVGVSDPTETVDPSNPDDPGDPNVGYSDGTGSNDGIESATIIRFGSYPQSKVTDSLTISALNSKASGWKSYNYYIGTGYYSDGQMSSWDYMRYCDVKYGGNKYRGVVFDSYRPYYTGCVGDSGNSGQDENGYETNTVYWFKYEPLRWRILDASTGLVMCETIIDDQPYNNYILNSGTDSHGNAEYWGDSAQTYYSSDYENSSIRKWLREDFYATAFSQSQQSKIKTTTLNNDGYYTLTGTTGYEDYDSNSTNDKIFLLSYDEVLNSSYGFSTSYSTYDSARQAEGSDYAKCQGLSVESSGSGYGYSFWRLRSPGRSSYGSCCVDYDGDVNYSLGTSGSGGVRPALKLNLSSLSTQSDIGTQAVVGTGVFKYSCSACEAGGEYILLNVTGYGDNFTLSSSNLEYIDQLTADSSGKVSGKFMPRKNVSGSTTLLIGKFGNSISATKLTVTEETTGSPDPEVIPDININNYKSSLSVDYKSKLIFHTDIEAPKGYKIVWSNGDEGSTCTINQATNSEYKIKADLVRISDNKIVNSTREETVKVNTGFFAKIIAFFRGLFKSLPVYEDNNKK